MSLLLRRHNLLDMFNKCNYGTHRKVIDLRSDTVTKPTRIMREAMATALVGDDVHAEDPTVNELERRSAQYFGKPAALFVASGTMANLLAVMSHCTARGSELIVGQQAHMHRWEQGNYAQLAGVSATTIPNSPDGTISLDAIRAAVNDAEDDHQTRTRLICLENTHNYCGGRVISVDYMRQIRKLADEANLVVHVDGARLVNAAVASNCSSADLVADADSVQICFSKGLGAPVGSILCGSQEFIQRARRSRKAIGGGWRQAGILAAACLVALENGTDTVANDHRNAQALAQGINRLSSGRFHVDMDVMKTNLMMVQLTDITSQQLSDKLAKQTPSILGCANMGKCRLRLVTNCDVSESDIDDVISAFARI